jgi:hypothetical protein
MESSHGRMITREEFSHGLLLVDVLIPPSGLVSLWSLETLLLHLSDCFLVCYICLIVSWSATLSARLDRCPVAGICRLLPPVAD